MTKAYKATYNYQCKNQTYEIGQEYKLDQKPILCKSGFHYCKEASDTLNYYDYNHKFKLLEIEDLNPTDTITEGNKSCSNHIKVIREITDSNELLQLLGCIKTFDSNGRKLTFENSNGYSQKYTYDSNEKLPLKDISPKNIKNYFNKVLTNNYFYLPYIPLKNRQSS